MKPSERIAQITDEELRERNNEYLATGFQHTDRGLARAVAIERYLDEQHAATRRNAAELGDNWRDFRAGVAEDMREAPSTARAAAIPAVVSSIEQLQKDVNAFVDFCEGDITRIPGGPNATGTRLLEAICELEAWRARG